MDYLYDFPRLAFPLFSHCIPTEVGSLGNAKIYSRVVPIKVPLGRTLLEATK